MNANPCEPPLFALPLSLSRADFLAELALCLGLPAHEGGKLLAPQLFAGPGGLLCRVHLDEREGPPAARADVLLPLSTSELGSDDISRLLSVQALLMSELGWSLGVSPEGLLQLVGLGWLSTPREVAAALDSANEIGPSVVRSLMLNDAQAPEHTPH